MFHMQTKYVIPEEGKDWVLKTICDAWRMYKSRFKAEYYTKYDNDEERLKRRPQSIPLEKFKILLQYWGDEKIKSTAVKNANNRRRVIDTHTAGRTSFAQIRNDMVCSWILINYISFFIIIKYVLYLLIIIC